MYGYHGVSVCFLNISAVNVGAQLILTDYFSLSLSFYSGVVITLAPSQRPLLQPGGRRARPSERRRDRAAESWTVPAQGEAGSHVSAGESGSVSGSTSAFETVNLISYKGSVIPWECSECSLFQLGVDTTYCYQVLLFSSEIILTIDSIDMLPVNALN